MHNFHAAAQRGQTFPPCAPGCAYLNLLPALKVGEGECKHRRMFRRRLPMNGLAHGQLRTLTRIATNGGFEPRVTDTAENLNDR